MKFLSGLFFAGFLTCILFTGLSLAQVRDMAKEEKHWQQLQKVAPKALDSFKAGTAALDDGNYAEAVVRYQEVLKQAPDFEPALRRLGNSLTALGNRADGLKLSQKAIDLNRSPDNLLGHAYNLAAFGTDLNVTQAELTQAFVLAKEAMQKDTQNDPDYAMAVAQLALSTNNLKEFNDTVTLLNTRFPDQDGTHYYYGIALANEGDYSRAEAEIKLAESLGIDPKNTKPVLMAIEEAKGQAYFGLGKYFYPGLFLVLAWAAGLLVLFIVGKSLSVKTLRSIETSDPNDITGGGHAGLRKIYRRVIWIAGIYYYLSQPIVMLLVAVISLGIILFFFSVGTIPVKLVLVIGFVALATLFYMVKSLLVRTKVEDPGRALTEDEAPGLWATVRDVARTVETRPVNEIRITPGTEVAVYERGGMREKLQDKAERILIVGVAVLNDFDQNAFRAVLAHEYGHFSNRDTAGGDIAFRVNEHIFRLAEAMGRSGTATFYNIAFQFLRLYHFLFRRITHGATRLQEVLADRVAVYQYGAAAFREGLTHVVRREIEFNHVAEKEINAAFGSSRAMQNLYELNVEDDTVKGQLDVQFDEAINRPTTEDDTHPSPADRFKLAGKISSRESAPLAGGVWDLFKDRDALTREMNALVEQNIKASM
jgi:tetratricopeptide (TPR) repeat protein